MKKIITTIAFIALCTVSAKAADFSVFSITGGIAANQGVFGATATEVNDDQSEAPTAAGEQDQDPKNNDRFKHNIMASHDL